MSDSVRERPSTMRRFASQNELLQKRGHEEEPIKCLSLKKSKTVDNLFGLASFHNENNTDKEQLSRLRLEPDVLRRFDALTLNTTNAQSQTNRSSSFGSDLGRTLSSLDEFTTNEAPTGGTSHLEAPHRQHATSKTTTFHDESGWSLDYSI